ncbi:unnamed protein product [Knipowitschia caucasica]|uniref:Ubiquitin-associated protein 1 n=1 Tax=Knipowitschia caucasica TaxID=637954 RepID=A0AAV2M5H6_KNICA
MAARKSASDAFNNGPVSYLEDVPFKLSEKFRCPAKVGLPVGFCLPDAALLGTQYDFSLERRSVAWGAGLEEAAVRGRGQAEDEEPVLPAPPHLPAPPLPPALNPVLAALSHDAILTPVQCSAPSPSPAHTVTGHTALLDLTDFERAEDPFDKLELKTIDEKEELRSILQPSNGLHNGLVDDRPCNIRSLSFPKLSESECPEPTPPVAPLPVIALHPDSSPQRTHSAEVIVTPARSKSAAPKPVNCSSLPCGGALLSMTPAERQCVETLVGMGYSYEGVLRAMQRQGQSVETVLDYLYVHNRLCERGYEATAVEEGLELYHCEEDKALQFLQLMSRFGEMGFERDAIKEVLLFHNNDQDKALEELMSRSTAT